MNSCKLSIEIWSELVTLNLISVDTSLVFTRVVQNVIDKHKDTLITKGAEVLVDNTEKVRKTKEQSDHDVFNLHD